MRKDKVKDVRIFAPAAILTFEEGTSRERLSLSLKSLSRSVLGEEDPLLTEHLRITSENQRLKEALEDIRTVLSTLESEQYSEDEDDKEWEELSRNPEFIAAMLKIVEGLEKSNIDWDKIKKVSFEELKAKYSSKNTK